MQAATRPARLRFDLAAAAGPSLGSAKEPALTPVWQGLLVEPGTLVSNQLFPVR